MVLSEGQQLLKQTKTAAISVVALLLVLYVLADVTILQIVHGNESVGIPAPHHLIDHDGCNSLENNSSSNLQTQSSISTADDHHNSNEDCSGEGECLASCSHIVVSYFRLASSSFVMAWNRPIAIHAEETAPKSHPSDIFHPPQTA